MIDEDIVMETIRKMKEAGLENSIILSTLEDIGLNEKQAQEFIDKTSEPALSHKAEPAAEKAAAKKPAAEALQPKAKPEPKPVPQPEEVFEGPSAEEGEEILPEEDLGEFSEDEEAALSAAFEEEETPAKPRPGDVPESAASRGLSKAELAEEATVEAIRKIRELPPRPPQYSPEEIQWRRTQFGKSAFPSGDRFSDHIEETAMQQAATEITLAEQEKKISEMRNSITEMASRPVKLWPGASEDTKALMLELERLSLRLEETRAMTAATRALMEKILEVDRKILARLP